MMQFPRCHLQNLSRLRWAAFASQAEKSTLKIYHSTLPTLWGNCFIAVTDNAICQLAFFDDDQQLDYVKSQLHSGWQTAAFFHDPKYVVAFVEALTADQPELTPLLHLKGSRFQLKVWEALLDIPMGNQHSYQSLAATLGNAQACRAVACAVAKNQIACLIPCHRIIRKNGDIGNYRWGVARKRAILHWESLIPQTPPLHF